MASVLIFTGVILLFTLAFGMGYYIFASTLDYKCKEIRNLLEKQNIGVELQMLVVMSLKKINGWNKMAVIYTILQYVLNLWSISFSIISIYCIIIKVDASYSILFTFISVLSLVTNLFLRCDKKWSTYRYVLAKGRIVTNTFISKCVHSNNIAKLVKNYSNRIIRYEQSIKDAEIS